MGKKKKTKTTSGSAVAAQDGSGNDGPAFEEAAKTVEAPTPATSSNADSAVAAATASPAPVVKMHLGSDSASPPAVQASSDIQSSSSAAAPAAVAAEPAAAAATAAPAVEKKAALSPSPKGSAAQAENKATPAPSAAAPSATSVSAASPAKSQAPVAAASTSTPASVASATSAAAPASSAAAAPIAAFPAAAAVAASAAPVATSSAATPNPHASALAAILLTPLKKVKSDVSTFSASSLDSIFSQIQSLPYDVKSQFFASITSRKSDANAASSDLPSKIFAVITNYLSDGLHSGSNHDPVCKFFYEAYWEASTKMLNTDGKGSAAKPVDAPLAHLFVLQFLPQIIYQFLLKFSSNASIASPAAFAGLFTVCLAVYNTERILSARNGLSAANAGNSNTIPPEVEQLLGECKSLDVHAITPLWNASHPFNRAPSHSQSGGMRILPSILEPNRAAIALLVHVLLAKYVKSLAALSTLSNVSQDSIESFVYLIGATCGNGSAHQMFAFIQPFLSAAPVAPGSFAITWPTTWRQSVPVSFSFRFDWTSDVLQDFLDGLSWILSAKTLTSSSASSARFQEFVLSALRQVHGRAIEELQPIILLQTTQMLEQQEQRKR